uniref:Uncharacterized protein n=1 Tax=Strongyloides venezuelensis TaxID=75913 RepID=A0A0K0G4J5_STRVS
MSILTINLETFHLPMGSYEYYEKYCHIKIIKHISMDYSIKASKVVFMFSSFLKIFSVKKLSRCLKKWKSVGVRLGEHTGCGRDSYPNSFNFLRPFLKHKQAFFETILMHFFKHLTKELRINSFPSVNLGFGSVLKIHPCPRIV